MRIQKKVMKGKKEAFISILLAMLIVCLPVSFADTVASLDNPQSTDKDTQPPFITFF
jgi:hypothetical protein